MPDQGKQLSNPFSTGGGGVHFEANVQASFVVLMLTKGFAPALPKWPISKIKLQGKHDGYETDDLIVFTTNPSAGETRKLLAQIKHSISITKRSHLFRDVIRAAWKDFNNTAIFSKNKDAIALITGPLSSADTENVRQILEWARDAEDAKDFFTKVSTARFSSQTKQDKLDVIRTHLNAANGNIDLSDEDFFSFLKHFYLLGYDLDVKSGVTSSLMHSYIGLASQAEDSNLWGQIVLDVMAANKDAGTITADSSALSDEIKSAFVGVSAQTIPEAVSSVLSPKEVIDWSHQSYSSKLALCNLIGSWNEASEDDVDIVRHLIGEDYNIWIAEVREVLRDPESPLGLKNGLWSVAKRHDLWGELGGRLFDVHLENFKTNAIKILSENDPQFELPAGERYAAAIHDKLPKHSRQLRKGIAETLALLGTQPEKLSNCSLGKPEGVVSVVVRETLKEAGWVRWGTLNDYLPPLAEASPKEFLNAVESALVSDPCPFEELFAQEGQGLMGRNYLTGLYWALEALAWDEELLVRIVCILGDLASRDPGGNWVNRPDNSLRTIFLPWLPQTLASSEKCIVAVRTLIEEAPAVAWKLLLSLLPNQQQSSSGTHKPQWRNPIAKDWRPEISNKEYWDRTLAYAEMAIEMAKDDLDRLHELIGHLDNLPSASAIEDILECLNKNVSPLPEEKRLPIWTKLVAFVTKHKKYSDAKWALPPEVIDKVESVAIALSPHSPQNLYKRLFDGRDFDLMDERGDWQKQRNLLEEKRRNAIAEIIEERGVDSIIAFASLVESPRNVGYSFGVVSDLKADVLVLPHLLLAEDNKLLQFAAGFVLARFAERGEKWVGAIDHSEWLPTQTGQFYAWLPFTSYVWSLVLGSDGRIEAEYWSRVNINPYEEKDLSLAITKLLEYGRPIAAMDCIQSDIHEKREINTEQAVSALLLAVNSDEALNAMEAHHAVEIIQHLQGVQNVGSDDLFNVEWAYLRLLEDETWGCSPKTLWNRLASDPEFFCEVIRLVYRSNKDDQEPPPSSEEQQRIATNAYHLLHSWKVVPGTTEDGSLNKDELSKWVELVKTQCEASGHLEVAMIQLGHVLIYSVPDPDGLWIHRAVATVLNTKDGEDIRSGYRTAVSNSRGVHWVDATGKQEKELAEKYRGQAEEVENAGYARLAVVLRSLAESYDQETQRVIDDHDWMEE